MINLFTGDIEYKQVVRYGKLVESYYVTKCGIVYSTRRNRILKQSKGGNSSNYDNAYWIVGINGVTTHVHRIVMETWKPIDENPPEQLKDDWEIAPESFKQWVRETAWGDHINGDKDDNHVDSMKWVTPRQNNHHFKKSNSQEI